MEIEKRTRELVSRAVSFRASDIHFVPMEKIATIRFRVDGKLIDMERMPVKTMVKLIGHLKFISGMDVGERRRPQSSALEIPLSDRVFAMRLSTFPSSFHETLVIRLFPQNEQQSLQQLSIFPKQANQLLDLIKEPNGLFLVCGPTGSGKTTTLYSLLHSSFFHLNRNIITLEDPVEQKHDHFLQMEINERAGITYSVGLRSLLRHDPDLIMIGEIRDSDTAKMAIRASMTGHLVLSTLHSKDTVSALRRLHELGIPHSDLRETVKGVVAQRLVNLVCPFCGKTCHKYCRKQGQRRRGAIYEILTGDSLEATIDRLNDLRLPQCYSLSQHLCKAIALGFVHGKEFDFFG